jgi:hypothetical protein
LLLLLLLLLVFGSAVATHAWCAAAHDGMFKPSAAFMAGTAHNCVRHLLLQPPNQSQPLITHTMPTIIITTPAAATAAAVAIATAARRCAIPAPHTQQGSHNIQRTT